MNSLHVPRFALVLLLAVAFTVPTVPPVAATGVGTPNPEDVGIDCETENSEAVVYGLTSPQTDPVMVPCIDVVSGIACAAGELEGALETQVGINGGFVEFSTSLTISGTIASWVHCTGEVRSSAVFYGGTGLRYGQLRIGTAYNTCTYIAPLGACRTAELSTPFDAMVVRLGVSKDSQFLVCQTYNIGTGPVVPGTGQELWPPTETTCNVRNYLSADEGTAHWDLIGAARDDPCSVLPCDPGSLPGPCSLAPCQDLGPTADSIIQTAFGAVNLVLQTTGKAADALVGPGGIHECVVGPGQQIESEGPLPEFSVKTEPGEALDCGEAHMDWVPLP